MAALYPGTSVSGYNANPPPDDGTTVSTNLITWNSTIKAKLSDPLNTFAGAVDSNITAAFGKTLDGASVATTSTNYAAGPADQGRLIKATSSGITITTPDASSVGAPFTFAVNNQSTGTITLAGNSDGSQTVDGQTTQIIQPGGGCIVKTDGTNWYTYGLTPAQFVTGGNVHGFDMPVNLNLVCTSVSSNTLLQVAVKTKAGNDPSAGDPVLIPFRDATAANGDPVWLTITSALNMTTNATGATLGTQNSVPFRFWILMFNNAGTPELALWNSGASASTLVLNSLSESELASTTGISSGATSAGVFYTPNGVSLSSCAFRIIGYLDYSSGLTTAGTYASAPTKVQLFGPGVRKPGDVIQVVYGSNSTAATTSSTTFAQLSSAPAPAITPSSKMNLIETMLTSQFINTGSGNIAVTWSRGTSAATNLIGTIVSTTGTLQVPLTLMAMDYPATSSSQAYTIQGKCVGGTLSLNGQGLYASTQVWTLKEIMG